MWSVHYSINTFLLYLMVGLFCSFYLYISYNRQRFGLPYSLNKMLSVLWLFLTIFAAFRLVTNNGVGGTDAANYESFFLNPNPSARMVHTDVFFYYCNSMIRKLTDNTILYRFICYGFISLGYIAVIKRFCNNKISFIPFILLIFPYLRSFNTMRNSIAISVFLIGIVLLANSKSRWKGCLVMLAACFFHRMTVLYLMFIPFYFLFRNRNFNNSRKLFIFLIAYTVIGYYTAIQIQTIVVGLQLLAGGENADAAYLAGAMGQNIFDRLPMLAQHIALLASLIFYNSRLPKTEDIKFLRLLVVFDIIIMPISLVFGMWRAVEYLYVIRLVMWGYLIYIFLKRFSYNTRIMAGILAIGVVLFWLGFRIDHEWEDAGLMPYIPLIFA